MIGSYSLVIAFGSNSLHESLCFEYEIIGKTGGYYCNTLPKNYKCQDIIIIYLKFDNEDLVKWKL